MHPLLLLAVFRANAGEQERTECDGLSGKEQLVCIEEHYPKIFAKVKELCHGADDAKTCREREFSSRGIDFAAKGGSRQQSGRKDASGVSDIDILTVRFLGAQVGPGTTTGQQWDGMSPLPPSAIEAMAAWATGGASLAAPGAAGEMGAATISSMNQGLEGPEVVGNVAVVGTVRKGLERAAAAPMALATGDHHVRDSFSPSFPLPVEYQNWPVYEDTRFQLYLWDHDLSEDDPIGTVQVNKQQLLAALAKQSVYEVQVADQSGGQLLLLRVSVTRGAGSNATVVGEQWR